MGFVGSLIGMLFGGGRNVVTDTLGAIRPNAEASAQRAADHEAASLAQFGAEFASPRRGLFDRLVDALNRLPRPILALGVIALFVAAMNDPVWFAARMQGLALVPDQMWWLLGAVVTFYFGARYQAKAMDTKRILQMTPTVLKNIKTIREMTADSPGVADTGQDAETELHATAQSDNQAVVDWRGER